MSHTFQEFWELFASKEKEDLTADKKQFGSAYHTRHNILPSNIINIAAIGIAKAMVIIVVGTTTIAIVAIVATITIVTNIGETTVVTRVARVAAITCVTIIITIILIVFIANIRRVKAVISY